MTKRCFCFLLWLTMSLESSDKRCDYDIDSSMQTYVQVCKNAKDLRKSVNRGWRINSMFNHKSNLYFISGDNYYIKEGTSTWVIDKDGVCIASFYPFCHLWLGAYGFNG